MFLNIFKHLLPDARAWRLVPEKFLRKFFSGLANSDIAVGVKLFFDEIFTDIDPVYTRELQAWENQFGLTDTGLTEPERRDRLAATWQAVGGQDPRYIQDTLQAAGFPVYIHEWWNELIVSGDVGTLDVSTAVYNNNFLNVVTQDTDPQGIAINNVGGRVYMVGNLNDFVYQYNLFKSFDLSSGLYSGKSLDVGTEIVTLRHIAVSNDEARIYAGGVSSFFEVHQYNATTPGDLDTASYSGLMFDVSTEIGAFRGMTINPDETRMYVMNGSDSKIYQYNIADPGDISTAVYSLLSSPAITEDTAQRVIYISDDETRLYLLGTGDVVYQYDMTAGDISTLSYSGNSFDVSTEDTVPLGMCFNPLESKMFITGNFNDKIFEYDLASTPGTDTKVIVKPPLPRNPFSVLVGGGTIYLNECGEALAQCGELLAECGERASAPGYPLVNKDGSVYNITVDPLTWPYYLYIGGEIFGETATVDANRKDEFEDLCLKICPAQQWLGIIVTYT